MRKFVQILEDVAIVLPYFDYCGLVWDNWCGLDQTTENAKKGRIRHYG